MCGAGLPAFEVQAFGVAMVGRTRVRREKTIKLNDLVENFPSDRGLVFCDEGNENLPTIYNALINETKKYKKWSVIIGPEGGFSEKERRTISSLSSCISVSLGKRILRSDTATTAAIFSIQSVIE